MLVSAISATNNSYNKINGYPNYQSYGKEFTGDSSIGSKTPYFMSKDVPDTDSPIVYDSINQWKKFCEHNIVGEKLNILA